MTTDTIALLDCDITIFKIASSLEQSVEIEDEWLVPFLDIQEATQALDAEINSLANKVGATRIICCLTNRVGNFRRDVYPAYKGKRKGMKPFGYGRLREHVVTNYETFNKPNLEADDCLGIIATCNLPKFKGTKIILSIDKDLEQIPGLIFNWDKDKAPRKVTKEQGDRFFYKQILMGDMTDNYPGCPKIGHVKADKILDDNPKEDWWKAIVQTYEKAGLTEQDALTQARCARILQASEYDFKKQEVILWQPI